MQGLELPYTQFPETPHASTIADDLYVLPMSDRNYSLPMLIINAPVRPLTLSVSCLVGLLFCSCWRCRCQYALHIQSLQAAPQVPDLVTYLSNTY